MHACPVSTVESNDTVTPWGKMSMARWLAEGKVKGAFEHTDVLYKCTSCGACQAACVHEVDVSGTLQMAKEAAAVSGIVRYAPGLFTPNVEDDDDVVLPAGVSGARLFAAGYTEMFLSIARANARRWSTRSELLFASSEDLRTVAEVYPAHDIQVRPPIRLASEAASARPARDGDLGPRVAYHEACHLLRMEGNGSELVRQLAQKRAEGALIELQWRGETATCCGASGGFAETSPLSAKAAALRILGDAVERGAERLVTGCQGCADHMAQYADEVGIEVISLV
jgi:Fe-S oxidoreductase